LSGSEKSQDNFTFVATSVALSLGEHEFKTGAELPEGGALQEIATIKTLIENIQINRSLLFTSNHTPFLGVMIYVTLRRRPVLLVLLYNLERANLVGEFAQFALNTDRIISRLDAI